jgi:hypothetical protein
MGCTREVSGSSVSSSPASVADLGTVLLDAGEIDDVIGSSGSEVLDEGDAPDDVTDVDPPQCHGLVYIAGEIEYASTKFTAMRWRVVGSENTVGGVEMVAQLPSVASADEFIDEQTQAWKRCANEVVTSRDKGSAATRSQDRVTAVAGRPHMVIASMHSTSRGTPCRYDQHVLQAVSAFVLDVSACSNDVPDPAEAIASKLAERVQSG